MSQVPVEVNDFVQAAVNVVTFLLPYILMAVLAPLGLWVVSQWNNIKASQPEQVRNLLEMAAKFGADFAEKVGPSLKATGKEKLHLAIEAAEKWAKLQGYNVELDLLEAAIEGILFRNPEDYPSGNAQG